MAVNFSPIFNSQVVDSTGAPASGWLINTYVAGSSTPLATYTDNTGGVAQSNPIVLNSLGFPTTGQIWLTAGSTYKLVLTNAAGVVQKTEDNISGTNDFVASGNEWIASGLTPTYVSATSFTVTGDQTSVLTVGRRVRTTNTGGTIYSTISASVFSSVTTVTVVNDSGTLDSGLSVVSYGIQNSANSSIPVRRDVIPSVSGTTDATKRVRFEADGLTTATVRVATFPDYDIRIGNLPAGIGPLPYAGSSIPTGWLECDGSAVSRTTYAALFAAISTTWGAGDGSTTFNLPDFRDRVPIGAGTGTVTEAVTASSGNGFTVASNNTKWITGMTVVLSNLSGFTTSATAGPTYYVVRISATNVRLATTLALAQTGAPDITISGTGTATLTHTYTARTLGEYGGEETHAMSSTENLAHTHTTTGTISGNASRGDGTAGSGQNQYTVNTVGDTEVTNASLMSVSGTAASTGGNAGMNIMQPFGVVKYIISY